jgi:hypothetical protein
MTSHELDFAYKVRHALDEQLATLPAATTDSLAAARKLALSRKKKDSPLQVFVAERAIAGYVGDLFDKPLSWLGRFGLAVPVFVVAIGLVGIFQFEQQQRLSEIADIDAAVLSDELPLTAYVDHGFNAYLAKLVE